MSIHTQDCILFALMSYGPDVWYEHAGNLQPELFHGERRAVFERIAAKRKSGDLVDLITVAGTSEIYPDLAGLFVSRASIPAYVADLQKAYATGVARDIGTALMETGDAEAARSSLMSLDTGSVNAVVSGEGAKRQLMEEMDRRTKSDYEGIKTGLADLDHLLGGLEPGNLCVFGARPSMGKTAMLLNIAAHQNFPVGIFSLEMSTPELMQRMCAANGMDYGKIRHPRGMDNADWSEFTRASAKIRNDLQICDTGGLSIGSLESEAYRMVHGHGVRLIGVDYVQLVTCPAESRLQEVSEVSRRLKSLAKNLKIPIVALCQLNRAIEGRGKPEPRLSDLRETGQLEQDADQIIFIDRPEVHMPGERVGEVDLYVRKNRAGPVGNALCKWQGRYQRFVNTVSNQYARSAA